MAKAAPVVGGWLNDRWKQQGVAGKLYSTLTSLSWVYVFQTLADFLVKQMLMYYKIKG